MFYRRDVTHTCSAEVAERVAEIDGDDLVRSSPVSRLTAASTHPSLFTPL